MTDRHLILAASSAAHSAARSADRTFRTVGARVFVVGVVAGFVALVVCACGLAVAQPAGTPAADGAVLAAPQRAAVEFSLAPRDLPEKAYGLGVAGSRARSCGRRGRSRSPLPRKAGSTRSRSPSWRSAGTARRSPSATASAASESGGTTSPGNRLDPAIPRGGHPVCARRPRLRRPRPHGACFPCAETHARTLGSGEGLGSGNPGRIPGTRDLEQRNGQGVLRGRPPVSGFPLPDLRCIPAEKERTRSESI